MAWRGIHISTPARLSFKHKALVVEQEEEIITFSLEDIAWIVLDTQQVTLTAKLLASCMEASVPLIVSDDQHIPCGVALPFHQHFQQAGVAQKQMAVSPSLKRRLWREIVRAKITNQAGLLDYTWSQNAGRLRAMVRHVKPGDPENIEARAARNYWPSLFNGFNRKNESDRRNALLNYGYAILRAGLARCIVAAGLLPAFGIHHRSILNAFNLADDLIEPYRPAVDKLAHELTTDVSGVDRDPLSLEDRQVMARVLSVDVSFEEQRMPILTAIERTVESLVQAFEQSKPSLLQLPRIW